MQLYFWAQKEHLEDDRITKILLDNQIMPFIRYDSERSKVISNSIEGTTIADGREFPNVKAMTYYFDEVFTNGDFGRYNQHLIKWISHPTKPKWFIMQPTIWGDTAICFIKKLIKAGAQSITYTAYKQHLFRIFGVNIINPFRNQIPTWEKLMKKYPREFNFAWIHIEQVDDFKQLINWCKLNRIERVGICSSIESLNQTIRAETVVLPKIAEGFKIKYRETIYDDAAIKSNGTIVIHSENGNIYTSFNKCEIQL